MNTCDCPSFNNAPCPYLWPPSSKLSKLNRSISSPAKSSAIAIPATTSRVTLLSAHRATYETFLQENIFKPLGMSDTGYDDPNQLLPNRAAGYSLEVGGKTAAYLDMSRP